MLARLTSRTLCGRGTIARSPAAAQSADPSSQAAPKQRAEAALNAFNAGNTSALDELAEILQSNPGDSQLYRIFLPTLPPKALRKLPHLAAIITHYDENFASENTSFDYTDTIAKFYTNCLKVLKSLPLKTKILTTFLEQAYRNNRFFAGQRFASICAEMWDDPIHAQMIAEVLHNNPAAHEFIGFYLTDYSLPGNVKAAIAGTSGSEPPDDSQPVAADAQSGHTIHEDPFASQGSGVVD